MWRCEERETLFSTTTRRVAFSIIRRIRWVSTFSLSFSTSYGAYRKGYFGVEAIYFYSGKIVALYIYDRLLSEDKIVNYYLYKFLHIYFYINDNVKVKSSTLHTNSGTCFNTFVLEGCTFVHWTQIFVISICYLVNWGR